MRTSVRQGIAIAGAMLLGCAGARAPVAPGPDFAALERARIADLEAARDLGQGVLVSRARLHADPGVRSRALLALARIQVLETAPDVAAALADPEPGVRGMAAFAAGELALAWEPVPDATRALLARAVLDAEAKERDATAQGHALDALGRIRTPEALERLVDRLGEAPDLSRGPAGDRARAIARRSALALGVAARAKATLPARATARLARLAASVDAPATQGPAAVVDAELVWAALNALGQAGGAEAHDALAAATGAPDAELRAIATKGLLGRAMEQDVPVLRALLRDPEGRVAAEAVRAILRLATACPATAVGCPALEALSELEPRSDALGTGDLARAAPPLLALAQGDVPERGRRFLSGLRTRVQGALPLASEAVRPSIAWLDCRLAAAMDRQRGWLDEVKRCGGGRVPPEWRLRTGLDELARSPRLPAAIDRAEWNALLAHPAPAVRAGALGLVEPLAKAPAADAVALARAARPLLQDGDVVVRASAADALGKLGRAEDGPAVLAAARPAGEDVVSTYVDALLALRPAGTEALLEGWLRAPHAHVRIEAARGLTTLRGTPVRAPTLPGRAPPPAVEVPPGTRWRLETARGPVLIEPARDLAPRTVAQLSRLADAGFFRDLTFHRVVPDFVVQGGDPRGDGEGGPGFSMPCEVSPAPYLRGTVGMALGGKDTGGSQLFVATSPQPHLDGRYTVIGTVVSGLDAVDGLVEHDALRDWVVVRP